MRALVAPLYLVAASVLGLLASLGLTTLFFQKVLGDEDITYYVPFAAAVLLVALGSDYNVFVAGRIWEEARRYRLREAIAVAMPAASRAVTAAGLALAASFALLAIVPLRSFREFAFVMTAGVLVDTFIVRSMLVPALTSLFGEVGVVARAPRAARGRGRPLRARRGAGRHRHDAGPERDPRDAVHARRAHHAQREPRDRRAPPARPRRPDPQGRRARPSGSRPTSSSHRVAEREGVPESEARVHARAVLTALEDTSADDLAYLRGQLSDDYEDLFAADARRRPAHRPSRRPRGAAASPAEPARGRAAGGRRRPRRRAARPPGGRGLGRYGSISTPGLSRPAGSSARLGRAQGRGERVRALRVVPRAVIAADAVVVRDRAARVEDRAAGRGLHLVPLRDLVAAPRRREHREVRRRAVGIDVRQAARDAARLAERRRDRRRRRTRGTPGSAPTSPPTRTCR